MLAEWRIAYDVVILSISSCAVALRFWIRYKQGLLWSSRPQKLGDFLLTVGWLCGIAMIGLDVWSKIKTIQYRPAILPVVEVPLKLADVVLKIIFIKQFGYHIVLWCVKGTFLCYYAEIAPRTKKSLRVFVYSLYTLTIVSGVAFLFVIAFYCQPISSNWDLNSQTRCSAQFELPYIISSTAIHILTDILIMIYPLLIFHQLQLHQSEKYAAIFILTLGLLTIAAAGLRVAFQLDFVRHRESNLLDLFKLSEVEENMYLSSSAEVAIALIVSCLPSLRTLFRNLVGGPKTPARGVSPVENNGRSRKRRSDTMQDLTYDDLTSMVVDTTSTRAAGGGGENISASTSASPHDQECFEMSASPVESRKIYVTRGVEVLYENAWTPQPEEFVFGSVGDRGDGNLYRNRGQYAGPVQARRRSTHVLFSSHLSLS